MKRLRWAFMLVFALWEISTAVGSVHAGVPMVTITPTPATHELCPGQTNQVLVVVRNNGTHPIRNVCMRAFTNGPITLNMTGMPTLLSHDGAWVNTMAPDKESCAHGVALPELMPGATLSRLLTFKLLSYSPTPATAAIWADYQVANKSKSANETAVGVLDVHTVVIPGTELLKIDAKTNFDSLHEDEEGNVLLTISNGTNGTLKLSTPTISNPRYTEVKQSVTMPPTVPPQSTVAISYKIKADSVIEPGKYTGLIGIDAQTSCGVFIHRAASYDITLGVFGQSELLTTLGVPSLLLLPGFLILTLWMLLWRFKELGLRVSFLAKSPGADEFFVGVKDAEFWLLGITFSLVIFWLSPSVMRIGYSGPYNLDSIAKVWGLSLLISAVLYTALLWFHYYRVRKAAEKTLTTKDDICTVVEKMVRRKWTRANCKPVKSINGVEPAINGFELWEEKQGESVWVIPRIVWAVQEGKKDDKYDPDNADIDLSELLRQLREITSRSSGTVMWAEESGFNAPCLMQVAQLEKLSSGDLVVVRQQS